MISVKHLTKHYGQVKALKGVSFEIKKGEIVGFLGPNGAGKTSTMKILAGYMDADSGQVTVGGFDGATQSLKIKGHIGYLPENNPLYPEMTVLDYLTYIASVYKVPKRDQHRRIKHASEQCGILDRVHQPISELSKGYKQRVGIASVLLHDPDVLILDEPTVGLDPNQILEIRDLIKHLGKEKTVILCSHILSEIEATCNRVLIINQGKIIAEGTPAQIRKKAKQKTQLHLTVEGKGETIRDVLEGVTGVKSIVEMMEIDENLHEITMEVSDSAELRKMIVKNLLTKKCALLEMYLKQGTLEEAFTVLTQ